MRARCPSPHVLGTPPPPPLRLIGLLIDAPARPPVPLQDRSAAHPLDPPLHLVDIPGHPRLRTRSLAQYLPAADGIVFTIDGAAGLTGKNVRDAAE